MMYPIAVLYCNHKQKNLKVPSCLLMDRRTTRWVLCKRGIRLEASLEYELSSNLRNFFHCCAFQEINCRFCFFTEAKGVFPRKENKLLGTRDCQHRGCHLERGKFHEVKQQAA